MRSFVARFAVFAALVTLLSIVGGIVAKFVAAHIPSPGLQAVVGAGV